MTLIDTGGQGRYQLHHVSPRGWLSSHFERIAPRASQECGRTGLVHHRQD